MMPGYGARQHGEERRPRRARAGRWLAGVLLAAAVSAAATIAPTRASAERPSQSDVEAAYLYNFGRFVSWPSAGSQGPMTICVAGQESFAQELSSLVSGEKIRGQLIQVKRVWRPGAADGCAILFVGHDVPYLSGYLTATRGKPVLTVGDAPDFLRQGGIIQFLLQGDHVRFSVNLVAANQNRLKLSSELLKVAVSVTGKPAGGGVE